MRLSVDIQSSDEKGPFLSAHFSITKQKPHVAILFGPSGAGKSTLLHCLAGIATPDAGTIRQDEIDWFDFKKGVCLSPKKRSVGLLFQDYSLFPHLTVFENIAYGLPKEVDTVSEVLEWLKRFRLEGKEQHFPDQLSGGEQQRVALAQTLAPRPSLVLLDEPFSALDRPTRKELLREVRKWLPNNGVSALVVLHHLDDAILLGDELIIMANGHILQQGKPEEIAAHPDSPAVAEMIGAENLMPAQVISVTDGALTLSVGNGVLHAVGTGRIGDPYYLSIREDDIVLEKGEGGETSARNHLSGKITRMTPSGLQVLVTIDCGFLLVAKITKQSAEALRLAPGEPITALIKASSIHLIPR